MSLPTRFLVVWLCCLGFLLFGPQSGLGALFIAAAIIIWAKGLPL